MGVAASRQREVELAAGAASLKSELSEKDREISLERRKETNLLAQMEQFNVYGHADPRNVSAAFAKAVADREVKMAIELQCTATWQCTKNSEKFPQGRAVRESHVETLPFPACEGMLLGARNHFVYVLVALPTELEMNLGWRPKPVSIVPKDASLIHALYNEDCPYFLNYAGMELKFQIRNNQAQWGHQDWTVIHAWNHVPNRNDNTPMTLMVIGCENAAISDMSPLAYRSDRDWLGDVERTNVLYPVSQMNGCVSLIPTRFDREYGHSGRIEQWSGFPGSIHAVFLPVENATRPVLHSLIIQKTELEALWIPAWAEKLLLDAPAEQFDLANFIRLKVQSEAGSPRDVVWTGDSARRVKLLESFRTLMGRAEGI